MLVALQVTFRGGAAAARVNKEKVMNVTDTAFVLLCASMVMLMTPALALFYGGLVRSRNVLSTHMHSYASLGVISILWAFFGYSLAFGGDIGGLIGDLSYLFLRGVGAEAAPAASQLPHNAFMAFQGMFAVLTVALISGAYAERIKFGGMLCFSCLWLAFVYCPMAHWVWGGGWMMKMGALDFVWFGWFGFNAGSALASGGLAAQALVNTHLASAAGIVGWMLIEWKRTGKATTLGVISGALAGLVAITPGAGFVESMSSIAIGFAGGLICYGGVLLKNRFHYDDALDVVGIHGIGGTWGALATGIFACAAINNVDGLLYGNAVQFGIQAVSVVATWVFVYIASRILLKVTDILVGLRVSADAEAVGLDLSEHNERGYNL